MADVTICIPAWQAEAFIDRTLECAKAQTHRDIRILVSVDMSEDRTADICRRHARSDARIEVIEQGVRLGFSENCNFLLDRVETEFCGLYFHDDIIEPPYIERLRAALIDDPEAQSAHCDLEQFGDRQGVVPAIDFTGSAAERLMLLLAPPVQTTVLRSLFRSRLLGQGLRFPRIGPTDGFWRCRPFSFRLIALGKARSVPEILYRRWFRAGSLTTWWDPRQSEILLAGQRASTALCFEIVQGLGLSAAEQEAVSFCLFVQTLFRTRQQEIRNKAETLIAPEALSEAFRDRRIPGAGSPIPPLLLESALQRYAAVFELEGRHAVSRGDADLALCKFAAAVSLHPGSASAQRWLAKALSQRRLMPEAAAVARRAEAAKQAVAHRSGTGAG